MNTVDPLTRESTVSFCNFTLSGTYGTLVSTVKKKVDPRTHGGLCDLCDDALW